MKPLTPEVQMPEAHILPANWPARIVDFIYRRRWILMGAVLAAALVLGSFARKVGIDNSLEVWFIEGDPALVAYDDYKAAFGNDELIIVAATDDTSVYTPAALERIRAASLRIEAHPKIRRVTSLALGVFAEAVAPEPLDPAEAELFEDEAAGYEDEEGDIDVRSLLPKDDPITAAMAAELERKISDDPIFRGTIVGDHDTMTLILVEPKTFDDFDSERPKILAEIKKIVDSELRVDGGGAHLGGIGVVYEGLNAASMRDTTVFTTLSYLIVMLGLWLLYRRIIWVAVGMGVVTLAVLATLGLAGLAGRDLNMVTGVLPTLIMTIGILDLIHLIDAYEEGHREGLPKPRILTTTLAVVVVPCIFNSITDAIGFMALSSAKMAAIRDLGWLAAAGLLMLLVAILVFAIPALNRFGGRTSATDRPRRADRALRRITAWCFTAATRHRAVVLATTVALFAVAGLGIRGITVDTYSAGFLPEDHEVRRDQRAIEEQFGPFIPLEFTVETEAPNGLKQPAVLAQIDAMSRAFESHPDVSRATGLPEIVKRSNQVWDQDKPESYAIPENPGVIAELLLTYGFTTEGRDNLEAVVDTSTYQITHVTARSGLPSARAIERTLDDLQELADEATTDEVKVVPAGYLPLYVRIMKHVTEAQITSFAIALIFVTLVMMILLRSIKLGVIAMIPNLLPAALTLGFMGFAGINLDVATVLIAAIAIGISVNDTSHIMFRFKHELKQSPDDPEAAVERMLRACGRPVIASSVILIAGFSVLLFATVNSVSYFGMLTSATILCALIADMIITPALLLTVYRRR